MHLLTWKSLQWDVRGHRRAWRVGVGNGGDSNVVGALDDVGIKDSKGLLDSVGGWCWVHEFCSICNWWILFLEDAGIAALGALSADDLVLVTEGGAELGQMLLGLKSKMEASVWGCRD